MNDIEKQDELVVLKLQGTACKDIVNQSYSCFKSDEDPDKDRNQTIVITHVCDDLMNKAMECVLKNNLEHLISVEKSEGTNHLQASGDIRTP